MKVMERYMLRRIVLQSVGATAATLGIVWTVQALTRINLVTDTGQSMGAFLVLATLLLPAIVPIIMPFAVLIGTSQTLNTMSTDSELAVIHAAGTPKIMLYRPIMIVALAAAAITILFGNFIEPYARQAARSLVAEARADLLSLLIQEGSFRQVDKNLYMQVAKRLPDGGLHGLFIADSRDDKVDMVYYAREGALLKKDGATLLLMTNGEIHRRQPKDGQMSIIRFTSYAFDLSEFAAAQGKPVLMAKDQTTQYLWKPDTNDKIFQKRPLLYRAELHRRLSEWMYPIAFALIAVGAGAKARSHRDASIMVMFNAIAAAFLLRLTGFLVESRAESHAGASIFIYLVPFAGIVLPIILSAYNIAIEWPQPVRDWFAARMAWFAAKSDAVRLRLSGFRRASGETPS